MFKNSPLNTSLDAQILLHKLGMKNLPIDPWEIAKRIGIQVKEIDGGNRYSGMMINHSDGKVIILNNRVSYLPRKRFTLAHELGHAEIKEHTDPEYSCSEEDVFYPALNKKMEIEANDFAAELLMPTDFIKEQVKKSEIDMNTIKNIATQCETSLTSSAFRYAKFSEDLVAIILSERNKVKYFQISDCMREKFMLKNLFTIRNGDNLTKGSTAYSFFINKGNIATEEHERKITDLSIWFPNLEYGEYDCYEDTIFLANYEQTLSLVWLEAKYDEIDEDDEEEEDN